MLVTFVIYVSLTRSLGSLPSQAPTNVAKPAGATSFKAWINRRTVHQDSNAAERDGLDPPVAHRAGLNQVCRQCMSL